MPSLRIAGGTVKSPIPERWRERNPWLAFEDGYRHVRGFVQRLEGGSLGALEARFGTDLRSLVEGANNAIARVLTPGALERLASEPHRDGGAPRIRLVLGQPPPRFSQERLGLAYHGTAWALGREAAALLPLEPLLGPAIRAPWSWQAAALRRSLEAVEPASGEGRTGHPAPRSRRRGGAGRRGAGRRRRRLPARRGSPDRPRRRGRRRRRARAARRRPAAGAAHPQQPPARGHERRPRRSGARSRPGPVRAAGAHRGPALLGARGRGDGHGHGRRGPARTRRARPLRAAARRDPRRPRSIGPAPPPPGHGHRRRARRAPAGRRAGVRGRPGHARRGDGRPERRRRGHGARRTFTRTRTFTAPAPSRDPVERVIALVQEELGRHDQHRVEEIEPGRWWLGDRAEREAASIPLADRVEWAVYSLLSTAGPIAESAFFERVAALFPGHDLPDETLVRACLASYRSPASHAEPPRDRRGPAAPDRASTRSSSPTSPTAAIGSGMRIWIGKRDQARRIGDRTLGDFLDPYREREPWFPTSRSSRRRTARRSTASGTSAAPPRCCSRSSGRRCSATCSLRRHARIPPDERIVRFLVLAPERRELARHKLESSPVLRDGDGDGELARHPVAAPAGLAGARPARPRRPRAVPRPRPGDRAARRAARAVRDCRRRYAAPDPPRRRDPTRLEAHRARAIRRRPARRRLLGALQAAQPDHARRSTATPATTTSCPIPSPAGRATRAGYAEDMRDAAAAIPDEGLSVEDRITRDVLRVIGDIFIVQDDQRIDTLQVVDQMGGPQTMLPAAVPVPGRRHAGAAGPVPGPAARLPDVHGRQPRAAPRGRSPAASRRRASSPSGRSPSSSGCSRRRSRRRSSRRSSRWRATRTARPSATSSGTRSTPPTPRSSRRSRASTSPHPARRTASGPRRRRRAVPDPDPALDHAPARPARGPPGRPRRARDDRGRAAGRSPAAAGFGDDTAAYRAPLAADPANHAATRRRT